MKTDVRIVRLIDDHKTLRAIATVGFDGQILITGVKVIDSEKGLFVSMPRRRKKNGNYVDICFPLTREMRQRITSEVMAAYEQAIAGEKHPMEHI